jgi:hypothetical protein
MCFWLSSAKAYHSAHPPVHSCEQLLCSSSSARSVQGPLRIGRLRTALDGAEVPWLGLLDSAKIAGLRLLDGAEVSGLGTHDGAEVTWLGHCDGFGLGKLGNFGNVFEKLEVGIERKFVCGGEGGKMR